MNEVVFPKPGKYVVAVSGGIDSIVLLHMLQKQPGLELTVAHFDHGMRQVSAEDREFVQKLVKDYGLQFVYEEGRLGVGASEANARAARYSFLRRVKQASDARAIITAHHQDDVLETAIINVLRGTGRKGLTALQNQPDVIRPLLSVTKKDLLKYAQTNELKWREDKSNQNLDYLRNYVRHKIMPRLGANGRRKLLKLVNQTRDINAELDTLLVKQLEVQSVNKLLERALFNQLPHRVAREVMATWLRSQAASGFDSKTLERLVVAAKTASSGQTFPVLGGYSLKVNKHNLALQVPER
jgi:tRNA(Ile)-lysidine synthetase-like protein